MNNPEIDLGIGSRTWYDEDHNVHREDGPATVCINGTKVWYYQGKYISVFSQEEFERWLRLRAFL